MLKAILLIHFKNTGDSLWNMITATLDNNRLLFKSWKLNLCVHYRLKTNMADSVLHVSFSLIPWSLVRSQMV